MGFNFFWGLEGANWGNSVIWTLGEKEVHDPEDRLHRLFLFLLFKIKPSLCVPFFGLEELWLSLPILYVLRRHPALLSRSHPREILLLRLHSNIEIRLLTPTKLQLGLVFDEDVEDVLNLE